MKNRKLIHRQKRTFNSFLLQYKKYKAKIIRLQEEGRNEHRQNVLARHIEKLQAKLNSLFSSIKKASAISALASAAILASTQVNAQVQFAGASGVADNAFGISGGGNSAQLTVTNSVEMWDMDADGDLDAFTRSTDSGLVYRENIGTATSPNFTAPQMLLFTKSLGNQNDGLSFGDFDNDGDDDLLIGSGNTNDFLYYENIGNNTSATFSNEQVDPFGLSGYNSTHPEIMDLDNDGDLDVMFGQNNGGFGYFENTGTASVPNFSTPLLNPFGLANLGNFNYSTPVMKDLDNDGDLDLLTGSNSNYIFYFENIGTASSPNYATKVVAPFNMGMTKYRPRLDLADVDGDGDLDILGGNSYGNFMYMDNVGTATSPDFSVPNQKVYTAFGIEQIIGSPELVDIDGDGDLDLFSSEFGDDVIYFENTGTSTNVVFGPKEYNPFNIPPLAVTDIDERAIKFIDIDNDGDLDLFSGQSNYSEIAYYENTGTSTAPNFPTAALNPFGLTNSTTYGGRVAVSFGDLDDDGDFDIISGTYYGNLNYFENTGTASAPAFGLPQLNPMGLSDLGYKSNPELIDIDADGDLDIIAGEYYGSFQFFENTGTTTAPAFAAPVENSFGFTNDVGNSSPTFGDLDGDGDLDLISGDFMLTYYENISTFSSIETQDAHLSELNSYPNPTSGIVTFDLDETTNIIEIFTLEGQLVLSKNNSNSIDVSELSPAVYIAKVTTGAGIFVNQLIKE